MEEVELRPEMNLGGDENTSYGESDNNPVDEYNFT